MPKPLTLPIRNYSREEMQARIARFADLTGFSTGFRDNVLPNTLRTLINVIGFDAPKEGFGSPVGADASRGSAIQIQEGFNLAYVRCKPGNGPVMHNHDTNETFIPMTGVWRASRRQAEQTLNCTLKPDGGRVARANAGELSFATFVSDNGDFPAAFGEERHVDAPFVTP